MERRSRGRGRGPGRPSLSTTKKVTTPQPTPSPVPSPGGEDVVVPASPVDHDGVVLNKRGLPARQVKKNRFFFDEETMVTDPFNKRGRHKKNSGQNNKTEPEAFIVTVKDEPSDLDENNDTNGILGHDYEDEEYLPVPKQKQSPQKQYPSPQKPTSSARMIEEDNNRRLQFLKEQQLKEKEKAVPKGKGSRARRQSNNSDLSTISTAALVDERHLSETKAKDKTAKERRREREILKDKVEAKKAKARAVAEKKRRGSSSYTVTTATTTTTTTVISASALMTHALDDLKHVIDKKAAQEISLKLRNLLKLPKAHKWVCYEWFYSNIDKVLFEGENDFQSCLRDSFPSLKARKLRRVEWCKIRRIMGKPRRCSQSFFDEEREELFRRRNRIRLMQQRKMLADLNYKDMPEEIPLALSVGTKVTARLRKPQDGLFTGVVEGVDTYTYTYRITFDRQGLGSHSIPDYEVLSNEPVETLSTSSFALKMRRPTFQFNLQKGGLGNIPMGLSSFPEGGMLGGFPIRLLDMIVRFSKLLKSKREKVMGLRELNVEAEKMTSYGKSFSTDFRLRYARSVLELDHMNKDMVLYNQGIQGYCEQIAADQQMHGAPPQMLVPEQVQEQCDQEAAIIVETCNTKTGRSLAQNPSQLQLVSKLTSMMLQLKVLSAGDRNLYELKSLKETIKDTKASLDGKNVQVFQNAVEIPMNRIQAGLCIYNKKR